MAISDQGYIHAGHRSCSDCTVYAVFRFAAHDDDVANLLRFQMIQQGGPVKCIRRRLIENLHICRHIDFFMDLKSFALALCHIAILHKYHWHIRIFGISDDFVNVLNEDVFIENRTFLLSTVYQFLLSIND